ncbi:hypothetical protein [Hyphococcus sp.]|uniref:hypothetical protein n=1 Tax=Hyphococcus sp. TaxID=2038636 RepID=UPI0035C75D8A
MTDAPKIFIGAVAAIGGFVATAAVNPFKGEPFDYATASIEDKQKYLERKAKNFSRGFNLTKGGSSDISDTYVDAERDLVSISVQMKGANNGYIPTSELEKARNLILKTACTLTERDLLTETNFKMRIRFFKPGGASLMTVEADGDSCGPYIR